MNNTSWLCYCIKSTDSNKTYIGVTDNLLRRLQDHNGEHGVSRGAKATRGEQWYPIFVVRGFHSIPACLSYEWNVKRVRKRKRVFSNYPKNIKSTVHKRMIDCSLLLSYGKKLKTNHKEVKWWSDDLHIVWLDQDIKKEYQSEIQSLFPEHMISLFDFDNLPKNDCLL